MGSRPLTDIQVIEFSHHLAGSSVGMILADLGATVVHIEKPGRPNRPHHATLHRGKHSIELDLTTATGLTKAKQLIAKADIIIEDFRAGDMAKLRLNFKDLCHQYPRLIALSLPPYSSDDEAMRDRKGTDATVMSHAGIFSEMGPNRTLMGIEPSFSPLPLASAYAAMIGAYAVVMALQARETTGFGDYIETSLASALSEGLLAYNAIKIESLPDRYKSIREKMIEERQKKEMPSDLTYSTLFSSEYMDPFFRPYRCRDGRFYYLVSIAHKEHATRAMHALGVYEDVMTCIKKMEFSCIDDVYQPTETWGKARSFNTYPVSPELSRPINEILEKAFLTKTALEWETIIAEHRAIGGMYRTLPEWMATKHARDSGLFMHIADPVFGRMLQPGPVAWVEGAPVNKKSRQFNSFRKVSQLLKDRTTQAKSAEHPRRPWLEGITVLDMCNVIAGPHAGSVLARLGADVIKLDPAKPTFGPSYILYSFNSGFNKRSILIDIQTKEGHALLVEIIKRVNIVIFNATTHQIAKLKLDNASIKAINPDVIFCHLDLFGGPRMGPWTNRIGYDDIIQVVSGIAARFGGGLRHPKNTLT